MTIYEKLKAMTLEEMATFLCDSACEANGGDCTEECPFFGYCSNGHNGAEYWLRKVVKE